MAVVFEEQRTDRRSCRGSVSFACLLRQHRLAARLSQDALAEQAGVSLRTVSGLERETLRAPYRSTVDALSGALALSAEQRSIWEASIQRHRCPRPSGNERTASAPAAGEEPTRPVNLLATVAAASRLLQPGRFHSLLVQWLRTRIVPTADASHVSERRRDNQLEAIQRQQALAAIVESSEDAIIGKTLDGTITSWNAGAEQLYGYTEPEVLGRPISLLIPADSPDELPAILRRLRAGEHIDSYETERITKDGRRLQVSVAISPIRDASGHIVGASSVARESSARVRAQRAAQEQEYLAQAAQAALQARDALLAVVSHDLRTSLTTLSGLTQLVARQVHESDIPQRDEVVAELSDAAHAAQMMQRMLDELLDFAQIEAGRPVDLDCARMDLVALVQQLAREQQRLAPVHEIRVVASVPELRGCWDAVRIERVLANLVSNAVKYSPAGGNVVLTLAADQDGDGRRWGHVTVQDSGIGIPAADLPQVFAPFYRGTNVPEHIHGADIGLAGARQIVEQHGGTLDVESAEGEGSRFMLHLPRGGQTAS
jgi:PAS domain S-box-containing protein